MRRSLAVIAAQGLIVAAGLSLAGGEKTVEAPADAGVCWHVVVQKDGGAKFNVVARNQTSL